VLADEPLPETGRIRFNSSEVSFGPLKIKGVAAIVSAALATLILATAAVVLVAVASATTMSQALLKKSIDHFESEPRVLLGARDTMELVMPRE